MFDPAKVSYDDLLTTFWEAHNPTLGMRQGNDIGSQYRSVLLRRPRLEQQRHPRRGVPRRPPVEGADFRQGVRRRSPLSIIPPR